MENESRTANIRLLKKVAAEFTQIEDSLVYAHLASDLTGQIVKLDPQVIKVDGSVFLLLAKGKMHINFNFEEYDAVAPAAISFPHGTMIRLSSDDFSEVDAYLLGYTHTFLQEVNISFSAVSGEAILGRRNPVMELKEREASQLLRYFSLIRSSITDQFNIQLTKHIVSSLTSAMFYQMMLLLYKQIDTTANDQNMGPRRSSYVHDFLKLVHLYYTRERSVNFYASQLFISPKYLSLLVKEATGRSAARWIDHFVITEAKNLLKYSGKNIQQVAYALNFSNQSSFGKYFKHLTGMSPTDFQKS